MGVQTTREAYQAGWRIHVRCAWGKRGGDEERAGVLGKGGAGPAHADLDTRGAFPLTSLQAR
jgi:hypothetical protein